MLDPLVQSSWWILILIGVAAGIVSGTLGVGSGIIFVPTLVIAFAIPQKSAQGTALAVMVPMALLGAIRYAYHSAAGSAIDIHPVIVGLLAVGALGGVLIGTELALRLPAEWLRRIFAAFLLIVAVRMFVLTPSKKPDAADGGPPSRTGVLEPKGRSHD